MAPTCRPALSGLTCYRGQRGPCDRPSTFHFLLTLPLCCCDLTLSPCGHSASSTLRAAAWEFPEGPSPALPSCDPWAPWSPRGRRGPGSHRVWHGEPVRRLRVTPSSRHLLGTWRDRQGPPCPEHSRYLFSNALGALDLRPSSPTMGLSPLLAARGSLCPRPL